MIDKIALTLAIIGGLNWGGVGLFGFDLVAFLFGGSASVMSRIVYCSVGLAAVWCISLLFRNVRGACRATRLLNKKNTRSGVLFCTLHLSCERLLESARISRYFPYLIESLIVFGLIPWSRSSVR